MSKTSSSTAFQTFSWIFRAKRPLQMNELREALITQDKEYAVDLDEMDMEELLATDILEICQNLVVYEEISGVVRFSHPTVQEFLESQVFESPPVVDLARTCLAYLQFNEFQGGAFFHGRAVEKRMRKYKFSRYAARFWGLHTKRRARKRTRYSACGDFTFSIRKTRTRCYNWKQMLIGVGALYPSQKGRHSFTLLPRTDWQRFANLSYMEG